MKNAHFYFIAGSSGGHIVPSITLAQEYRSRYPNASFTFITTNKSLDNRIFSDFPWIKQIYKITQPKFPGIVFWHYPKFFWNLFKSVHECWHTLKKSDTAALISMGGNISVPACFVAWIKRIPIDIYELNAIPGKAIRITAYVARRIFICFPEVQEKLFSNKCILTPYPIRFQAAQSSFENHKNDLKTIFILGGSQGSVFINTLVKSLFTRNKSLAQYYTIIHQTGPQHLEELQTFYSENQYQAEVFDFSKNLDAHYKKADLVICRSGAGALFETLFFQKKCITIPLESCADNHQYANAVAMTRRYPDLFTLVRQSDLKKDPELLDYAIQINIDHEGHEAGFSPNPKT